MRQSSQEQCHTGKSHDPITISGFSARGVSGQALPTGGTESGSSAASLDPDWIRDEAGSGQVPHWADARRVALLVGQYSRFIWRLLRRFGVSDGFLDDATQQVFIVAARKLDDVFPGRERAFLCGIAVRIASNSRRAAGQYGHWHVDSAVDELQSQCLNAELLFEHKQARSALDFILNSMNEDLRTVFVLCELEGLTAPETATIVDAPIGTVSSRLRRARVQFHEAATRLRQSLTAESPSTRRAP